LNINLNQSESACEYFCSYYNIMWNNFTNQS
jgi:hypothetical protein